MRNTTFHRHNFKAALAIAALLVLQSLFTNADARESSGVATDLNISAEQRELARFSDDLLTFNQQVLTLSKKARLTSSELASARSSGNTLKQRIAAAQQNFRSVIAKLKAANQWERLDAKLTALITDSGLRSILQSEGGAKKIWEDLANNLGSLAQEIDGDVQKLSGRVQSQSSSSEDELRARAVRVAYRPAPVFWRSLKCRAAVAVLTVKLFVGDRDPTVEEISHISKVCETNQTTG